MEPLNLRRLTLLTIIFNEKMEYLRAALPVLGYMRDVATFGRILLFSAIPIEVPGVEVIPFPPTDLRGHGAWFVAHIHEYITTDFMMYFQDDGFILEPSLWEDEFLAYDYIGAPWGDGDVGNTGFSIISRRLLQKLATVPYEGTPLDFFICKVNKKRFTDEGIRYAPVPVAIRFSTETWESNRPSFGYHGRAYNPGKHAIGQEKIKQWRERRREMSTLLESILNKCGSQHANTL